MYFGKIIVIFVTNNSYAYRMFYLFLLRVTMRGSTVELDIIRKCTADEKKKKIKLKKTHVCIYIITTVTACYNAKRNCGISILH